ncbi:MAG: aldolase/citrate lyase family protein, partial [Planctomycetaceae bacterium]|nr:aldolase/citrate lyase family protein [Planctomycetaceae bacterium]
MKHNPVKAALQAGRPQVGTWLSLGNVFAARLMARVGFPWLTIDIEHSPIDWSDAALLFGAIADAGCVPLARVPRGDHDHIKRVLDAGAHGIVVPMINTV